MKLIKPKISKYLTETKLNRVDNDLVDLIINDQEINFEIRDIEINGCNFINVDFSKYPLKNINLIDCIFEKCNLSNSEFFNNSIHRCIFDKCNLVGCDFISSSLQDISIFDTKGNYINFSDSKIRHFEIKNSVAKEGRFVRVIFEEILFDEVDFDGCEFLNTKLKDIDFSSCNLQNIGVSSNDVRGVIVNEEQALMLVNLLGIIVK